MYERMLDKQTAPSIAEMTAYCGENAARFTLLNEWISQTYGTERQITFPYGNRYGWGVAHRKKKKLICNVFAEAGAFTVMLRLSNEQFAAVYGQVRPYTRDEIDHKYRCGDGGWLQYRVIDQQHLDDIQILLAAKCS